MTVMGASRHQLRFGHTLILFILAIRSGLIGINRASSENLARPENRIFLIIGVCALIFYYFVAGFVRLVPSRFGFPEYDLDLSSHLQFQDLLLIFTILSIVGKNVPRPEKSDFLIIGVWATYFYHFVAGFFRLVPSRFGLLKYGFDSSSYLLFSVR